MSRQQAFEEGLVIGRRIIAQVSGSPTVGSVLTASATYLANPSYQWTRDGVDISGATASTYTVVSGDDGKVIACTVTGSASTPNVGIGPASAVFLPTLTSAPTLAYGAALMVEDYEGPLYDLQRTSDNAVMAVYPASGSAKPDYSAITSWAGGSALVVPRLYDQTSGGFHLTQATLANMPSFDLSQALDGRCPILWDGQRSTVNGPLVKKLSVSGLSIGRQNMTVFDVLDPMVSLQDNVHWEFTDGASEICSVRTRAASGVGYEFGFGATRRYFGTTSAVRAQPSVLGLTSSGAGLTAYVKEATHALSAVGAVSMSTLLLGEHIGSTSYNSRLRRWGWVCYPALSAGDAIVLRDRLIEMFSVPTSFDSRVVFDGDSIVEGSGVQLCKNMPKQLELTGTPEMFNLAVHGQTLATAYASRATRSEPLATSTYGAGNCLLVSEAATNDINNGVDAATVLTSQSDYVTALKAAGFGVGVATVLPRLFDSARETARATYNSGVTGGSTGADFVVDVAGDALMGPVSAPNDTTLYIDTIHPTSEGQERLAAEQYGPALNAQLAA